MLPKISLGLAGQIGPGFTLPISSTFLLPIKRNGSFIELGFGGAFLLSNKSFDFSMGSIIGFREQDLIKGGTFIRLSFIPTYFFINDEFLATGGISIGYSF